MSSKSLIWDYKTLRTKNNQSKTVKSSNFDQRLPEKLIENFPRTQRALRKELKDSGNGEQAQPLAFYMRGQFNTQTKAKSNLTGVMH